MKLLYFAWLRTRTGVAEEELTPPADVRDLGQLVAWLRTRSPGHAAAFADMSVVRAAINQDYAGPDAAVKPGDEVAFFPPVTGGGG